MELYDDRRRVVLVQGDKNKLYEQAIFILRAGAQEGHIDFVKEAERIINGPYVNAAYANAMTHTAAQPARRPAVGRKKSKTDIILNFALFATGIAIVALLFLNLL